MNLFQYGIKTPICLANLSPAQLYQHSLQYEQGAAISSTGALVALSGEKTGRSPKDKRVVEHPDSKNNIDWGDINIPFPQASHDKNRQLAVDFFNQQQRLYVVDGFAGWHDDDQVKIRVLTSRPYHALFMHNMLIRPKKQQLKTFAEPDYVIYNAGETLADTQVDGVESETSVSLSFEKGEIVILGTEYAGEMKKGVFTIMNYLVPLQGHLPMHCSATAEKGAKRSAVLFGLSGTGKTTLSADPKRNLIGDDEHIWGDNGIANIEGGCYAKVIDLSAAKEPDIFNAIRFGAVLENVVLVADNEVDYKDASITENTRASYPIDFIANARMPCMAEHPSDIIFLTCDAFGILPPVAKLSANHAMFHFISGYTAKIAGTEVSVTEPEATFSACFGAPFMVWHPLKYATLLAEKIHQHHSNVWLVNTGWTGGAYGVGSRILLKYSRAIINAINSGELQQAPTKKDTRFGFEVITDCCAVPSDILQPRNAWRDQQAYHQQANALAQMFIDNFKRYEGKAGEAIKSALPRIIC